MTRPLMLDYAHLQLSFENIGLCLQYKDKEWIKTSAKGILDPEFSIKDVVICEDVGHRHEMLQPWQAIVVIDLNDYAGLDDEQPSVVRTGLTHRPSDSRD